MKRHLSKVTHFKDIFKVSLHFFQLLQSSMNLYLTFFIKLTNVSRLKRRPSGRCIVWIIFRAQKIIVGGAKSSHGRKKSRHKPNFSIRNFWKVRRALATSEAGIRPMKSSRARFEMIENCLPVNRRWIVLLKFSDSKQGCQCSFFYF